MARFLWRRLSERFALTGLAQGLARKCLGGKALAAVAPQKPAASASPLTFWDRFNYCGPRPSHAYLSIVPVTSASHFSTASSISICGLSNHTAPATAVAT